MFAYRATWSSERVELLKRCFHGGLSCSEIAGELGVTRNAVIGKINRLGLSRPEDAIARQLEQRRAAGLVRPKIPKASPKRSRPGISAQHEMLRAAFPAPEDVPIHDGRGCTLLGLGPRKCRWPISDPGAADFCFSGNEPVEGLPDCPGHARIAYRRAGRQRRSASA